CTDRQYPKGRDLRNLTARVHVIDMRFFRMIAYGLAHAIAYSVIVLETLPAIGQTSSASALGVAGGGRVGFLTGPSETHRGAVRKAAAANVTVSYLLVGGGGRGGAGTSQQGGGGGGGGGMLTG